MKKLLLIILFFPVVVSAQEHLYDSLDQVSKYFLNEQPEVATKLLSEISSECEQSEDDEIRFQYYYTKAMILITLEEHKEALIYTKKGIEISETKFGIDSEYINLLLQTGDCYKALGDIDEAINYIYEAYVKGGFIFEENPQLLSYTLYALAILYEKKGTAEKVEKFYLLAHRATQRYFQPNNINYYDNLSFLASYHMQQTNYDKAITIYSDILLSIEKEFGRSSLEYARYTWRLATVYLKQKNFTTAISSFQNGMRIVEDNFGNYHSDLEDFYGNLMHTYICSGRKEEANTFLLKARDYYAKANTKMHITDFLYSCAHSWNFIEDFSQEYILLKELGTYPEIKENIHKNKELQLTTINTLFALKQQEDAFLHIIEYKDLCSKIYGLDSEEYAESCILLFYIFLKTRDFNEARKVLNKATRILVHIHGKDSAKHAQILHNEGILLLEQRKYREAQKCFLLAKELQERHEGKPKERTLEYLNDIQDRLQ